MRPLFDNQAFIEWIGKHKPDAVYTYDSCDNCLIARYLRYRGHALVAVGRSDVGFGGFRGQKHIPLPPHWNEIAAGKGKTFGEALARARKLLLAE